MDKQCIKVLVIGILFASAIAFSEGYYISKKLIDKEPLIPQMASKSVLSDGVQLHAEKFSNRQKSILGKAMGY